MWSLVSASVIGSSHIDGGIPCQDSCHSVKTKIGDEDVLIAAVSDGAGSAEFSQIGSKEAVEAIVAIVAQSDCQLEQIDDAKIHQWYGLVLDRLREVAVRENVECSQLACTLLLGIIWKNGAIFAQIGDGAWVVEMDGLLKAATWPEQGDFANITFFLTSAEAFKHLQIQRLSGKILAVAGFTDGIQMVTLDYAQKAPFGPFFQNMFGALRNAPDETDLNIPLQQLLASKLICSRTDDDKTLVLGIWREPIDIIDESSNGLPE